MNNLGFCCSDLNAVTTIQAKYKALCGRLDETSLRIWSTAEADSLGCGGLRTVSKAAGMSGTTIHNTGLAEIKKAAALESGKVPRATTDHSTRRWTSKNTYRKGVETKAKAHQVHQRTICDLLIQMHHSLQSTGKTSKDGDHEDRDQVFTIRPRAVPWLPVDALASQAPIRKSLTASDRVGGRSFDGRSGNHPHYSPAHTKSASPHVQATIHRKLRTCCITTFIRS